MALSTPNSTCYPAISKPKSHLQILLNMDFPKNRALKALAATGNKGVQPASDWLQNHRRDPFLDQITPRDYVLYACPVGAFAEDLRKFWNTSKACAGWNGAHNYTPHISLVSFFKASDGYSLLLEKALDSVMQRQGANLNDSLTFETHISPYSMALFVADEHAAHLKRIAKYYVDDVSNIDYVNCSGSTNACCFPMSNRRISTIGIQSVETMQLTLAYRFDTTYYTKLKNLAEILGSKVYNEWEIRLYSRDARVNGKHVHKVMFAYSPRRSDELELYIGDYVYLTNDAVATSKDTWVKGISWLTGRSGFFPVNFTIRAAESNVWTLHRQIPLNQC